MATFTATGECRLSDRLVAEKTTAYVEVETALGGFVHRTTVAVALTAAEQTTMAAIRARALAAAETTAKGSVTTPKP